MDIVRWNWNQIVVELYEWGRLMSITKSLNNSNLVFRMGHHFGDSQP